MPAKQNSKSVHRRRSQKSMTGKESPRGKRLYRKVVYRGTEAPENMYTKILNDPGANEKMYKFIPENLVHKIIKLKNETNTSFDEIQAALQLDDSAWYKKFPNAEFKPTDYFGSYEQRHKLMFLSLLDPFGTISSQSKAEELLSQEEEKLYDLMMTLFMNNLKKKVNVLPPSSAPPSSLTPEVFPFFAGSENDRSWYTRFVEKYTLLKEYLSQNREQLISTGFLGSFIIALLGQMAELIPIISGIGHFVAATAGLIFQIIFWSLLLFVVVTLLGYGLYIAYQKFKRTYMSDSINAPPPEPSAPPTDPPAPPPPLVPGSRPLTRSPTGPPAPTKRSGSRPRAAPSAKRSGSRPRTAPSAQRDPLEA